MTLTRKVLIVGEQPTEKWRLASQPALGGQCARRLVQLMDLRDEAHLRELFDMENLFHTPIVSWGTEFSRAAAMWLSGVTEADFLVLCGPRVQHAFQVEGDCEIVPVPMLTRPTIAACIPHPSRRVRSWKGEATVSRARIVLKMARMHAEGRPYVCPIHKGAPLERCGC
jgi:hypothetical protein